MVETPQPLLDAPGWTSWLRGSSLIAAKLDGADRERRDAYFLALHASTETLFRQVLFIGFRLNRVPYKDAQAWLHHHDVTPDREKYPRRFDRLYAVKDVSWDALVAGNRRLSSTLDLWHDYCKLIRNHLAHGVRRYSPEWVDCWTSGMVFLLVGFDFRLRGGSRQDGGLDTGIGVEILCSHAADVVEGDFFDLLLAVFVGLVAEPH